ncbi:hypothetical protein BT69DRAFT_206016 [Atractiella rhizophila]|nr:hypothetical protein BT69DRAFT_206016 [Atractiella rhizophila]
MAKQVKAKHAKRGGFWIVIAILGFLLPPLAVGVRFGIGKDFFINLVLTIAGYIPGHVHNFYLQNVRNNDKKGRTPKWVVQSGLVKDQEASKKKQRAWANRYEQENTGYNQYDDAAVPETRDGLQRSNTGSSISAPASSMRRQRTHSSGRQAPPRRDGDDLAHNF